VNWVPVNPSRQMTFRRLVLARIHAAEYARLVVVGKQFGIAPPIDDDLQDALGLVLTQEIFQLAQEAARRRAATDSLVDHAADVPRQRHPSQQMFPEDHLAPLHVGIQKRLTVRGQPDLTTGDLGKI
jgi:hypothetical protein